MVLYNEKFDDVNPNIQMYKRSRKYITKNIEKHIEVKIELEQYHNKKYIPDDNTSQRH